MRLFFLPIVGLALVLSIAAAITDTTSNHRHRRRQTRHWSNSDAGDSTWSDRIFARGSRYSDRGSSDSVNFMRQKKKDRQRLSSWLFALPVAIFLTSCARIISTGERFSSPLPELSQIAAFSTIWLLPALLLWVSIAIDHDETTMSHGFDSGGNFVTVFVPTGKTVRGDPESANFLANVWLVAYPIGYFYYTHLDTLTLTLTSFPNVDWIVLRIIFPVLSLAWIVSVMRVICTSSFFIFRGLILGWKVLVSLATINLLGWLLALCIPWLINLAIDSASWLFQR